MCSPLQKIKGFDLILTIVSELRKAVRIKGTNLETGST